MNTPINHADGSVSKMAMIQDVSERKQAEEELKQSKEFSETVINSMNDAIAVVDVHDYRIINANQVFLNIYNLKKEDVKRRTCYEITHHRTEPCTPPDDICPLLDAVESGKTSVAKHIHYFNDGTKRHMEVSVSPIRNQKGEITQVVHVSRDVTERVRGEEIIRDQAALLDKAQDAIIVRDLEHRIVYWNKSAARLYGFTEEEAIGRSTNELLDKEELPELIEAGKRVIEKGEWTGELRQVTKEGKEIIVESRWTLIHNSEGRPKSTLLINTNITEKKKLESQLLRAQRMESVGILAGGIAHDINNVLTPIMLSQELLQEKLTDEESKRLLNAIERSTKRGANLMKQIMSFARGVEGERNAVQVAHLISEIRQVAKETFPRNIEARTADIPKDLWTISGDATQLHQVIMNLCVNARDAMPDGGILSISAENFFIDKSYAKINTEARIGPHIVITVSDTGTGIPPEIIDRIFEPFFTTKEQGKGTGLGLSTSLGIVKSHSGFITVYSEVRKGTAFKVYLPAITTTETLKAEEQQHELPAGHGESILVVDDEDQIREITKKTLETHGYKVFIANDGKEAIALYSQHREPIKAVLMDMMMPVMDGEESIRRIRKINPEVKIIAVSGLTEKDRLVKVEDLTNGFLPKPYTAEKLLKAIDEVLSTK